MANNSAQPIRATIAVVVNPQSGKGRSAGLARRVSDQVRVRGGVPVEVACGADEVAQAIGELVDQGVSRVVLVGGDGLIHRCLPALADTPVTVGLVAAGSGNDFIRGLQLDRSTKSQIETAIGAPGGLIDLIALNQEGQPPALAASVVTGGISGLINGRANSMAPLLGASRYTLATLAELPRHRPRPATIEIDNEIISADFSMIAVANTTHFGGGMAICPDATPTDHLLDVLLVDATTALTIGTFFPLVYVGRHTRHPAVRTRRAQSVKLNASFDLWADGERLIEAGSGPVRITAGSSLLVAGAAGTQQAPYQVRPRIGA